MRESGFDPSDRFGPFSVDIIHYNPVCLNSLLYLMETRNSGNPAHSESPARTGAVDQARAAARRAA